MLVSMFFLINIIILSPPSFAQSEFDSKKIGLGMPTISVTPITGPPSTQIEILIKEMPEVPENLDPRIEFYVFLPFFKNLEGENVPQNCSGEKCFPAYSFSEIKQRDFSDKNITFALFSKTNPKPIIDNNVVHTICDLKVNGKVIERFGHACTDFTLSPGIYEIKFGWGIQRTNVYDIRETVPFTVLEQESTDVIDPKHIDDTLIQEFQNGHTTVAEFESKLRDLGYNDQNIRQTKSLLGLLDHQFETLTIKEKEKIRSACKNMLNEEPILLFHDKTNYKRNEQITTFGCVSGINPLEDLKIKIMFSDLIISEKTLIPAVDGSFKTVFPINESFGENGTYHAEATYGTNKSVRTFVVPEFGQMVSFILVGSILGVILVSKLKGFDRKLVNPM